MAKEINFICGHGKSVYEHVINSIIDPIRECLPHSVLTENAQPNAVNVHFFVEGAYRSKVNVREGVSVFMSHGIADKQWRDGPKVKIHDYICVSGPMWVDKMIRQKIQSEKILMIGYPKLDPIFQGKIKRTPAEKKRILWAPTHNVAISSYPAFGKYLSLIPDKYEVMTSLHPRWKTDRKPTLQQLADADIVITDTGSLIYEAWALGKPVIFPDWLIRRSVLANWPRSFAAQIFNENIGLHAENMNHMLLLIEQALQEGIDSASNQFIEGIFPALLRGKSGMVAAKELLRVSM